jgi:hypothetical protein
MLVAYEVKLADGQVVCLAGETPHHAMVRAADLYGVDAVAWRQESAQGTVRTVHHSQVIG